MNAAEIAEAKAETLDKAADIIFDRYMPACVCPTHGGYDVQDTVRRIVRALTAEADRLRTDGDA